MEAHSPAGLGWISEYAIRERERRNAFQIMLASAKAFRELLSKQVFSDLEIYYKEFPLERSNIETKSGYGNFIIRRTRDENAEHTGLSREVELAIDVQALTVRCRFNHAPQLDREFKIVPNTEGTLCLSDATIAELSRYILAPVLFDRLITTGENVSEID